MAALLSRTVVGIVASDKVKLVFGKTPCVDRGLRKDKRSVGWLSREIGYTRNHVYKTFNKPSLDSDLILRISNAMHFNFFQYYSVAFLENMKARIGEEKTE